jgi:phosphate starvation-inducible PhoH-like protein
VQGIGFTLFGSQDVVRHPLVARIVQAYERRAPDAAVPAAAGRARRASAAGETSP